MALTRDRIRELRAEAHGLSPALLLGAEGLHDGVVTALDDLLRARGLVKVRLPIDDRDDRKRAIAELAERTHSEVVQSIGKVAVYWRKKRPKRGEEER
jgi:RNA-binding protein